MTSTVLCPLCHRPLDPDLLAIQPKIEDHIARILSENNPGWKPEDGACPDCVHEAVEKAIEARSLTSLRAELLTPFPVYSREEKNIVYDMILNKALTEIHEGKTVVIDATFYKEDLRRRFITYLREPGMLHFIEIVADELLIKDRLSGRQDSHADFTVYKLIKEDWDLAQFPHLTIQSTNSNLNEMIATTLEYLKPYRLNKSVADEQFSI